MAADQVNNLLTDVSALSLAGLSASWRAVLEVDPAADLIGEIEFTLVDDLGKGFDIYPADPWRALRLTDLPEVKVVILGQDPYHGPGQAQGLAFSVNRQTPVPPSLRNIFTEIRRDPELQDGLQPQPDPDLTRWAEQGVLLLNTSLTVRDGEPGSHAGYGWEGITDELIDAVAKREQPCVFMLWGKHAQAKQKRIKSHRVPHLILCANHPSPLSANRPPIPFIGCGHFGAANRWLKQQGLDEIRW